MSANFKNKKYLFFDLDRTIAPARQPMLSQMFELLSSLPHDIVIVSGQTVPKIKWQSNELPALRLGQNGNHAVEIDDSELWNVPLSDAHRTEIHAHIAKLIAVLEHDLNHAWEPIEDRGAQITFSPIGNIAPVEVKMKYDPDRTKRNSLLEKVPFISDELTVKIGGSTSVDYIHKNRHKGVNVEKLILHKGWNRDECIYFGDGLFPGGNDEAVIGVIDTVPVRDHLQTYEILRTHFT